MKSPGGYEWQRAVAELLYGAEKFVEYALERAYTRLECEAALKNLMGVVESELREIVSRGGNGVPTSMSSVQGRV